MRVIKWILIYAFVLISLNSLSLAQGRYNGLCTPGAAKALFSGQPSSNTLAGIIPSCTVTVYLHGTTTLANLYSTYPGSPQSNPFVASTTGSYSFYTDISGNHYDVQMTGGIGSVQMPLTTISDIVITATGTFPFISTPIMDGAIYADLLPGNDIGAQINAAFAINPAAKVLLSPGKVYNYSTTWALPAPTANQYPILDGQGSILHYTGASNAGIVASAFAAPFQSGLITNLSLTGNPNAINGIVQYSRVGMTYDNISISNFTNSNASGLLLDNTSFPSSSGGWNERLNFHGTSYFNSFGIRTKTLDGGTNSYAYANITLRCQIGDNEWCLSVEGTGGGQSADMYGGTIDIKANGAFTLANSGGAIRVINGGSIRGSHLNFAGELGGPSGYSLYNDASSQIDGCGFIFPQNFTAFNGGASDQQRVSTTATACDQGTELYQPPPYSTGLLQATNWKQYLRPQGYDAYLPNTGGYSYAHFQISTRTTSNPNDPEVDGPNTVNSLFTNGFGNIGIGAGFNDANPAKFTLETHGKLAITAPTLGVVADGGTILTRYIDTNGNGVDFFQGAPFSGQQTFFMTDQMRDYTTFSTVTGMSRGAYGGRIHYSQPLHTPTSSSEFCNLGETFNDANYTYVCTSTNHLRRAALSDF